MLLTLPFRLSDFGTMILVWAKSRVPGIRPRNWVFSLFKKFRAPELTLSWSAFEQYNGKYYTGIIIHILAEIWTFDHANQFGVQFWG